MTILVLSLILCLNETPVFGGDERLSMHPVDVQQRSFVDSLHAQGVDSILTFRLWIYTNGYNGNGRVVWKHQGVASTRKFTMVGSEVDSTIGTSAQHIDSVFALATATMPHSEGLNYRPSEYHISHDSECRVEVRIDSQYASWTLRGAKISNNPDRVRVQLCRALADPNEALSVLVGGLKVGDQFISDSTARK